MNSTETLLKAEINIISILIVGVVLVKAVQSMDKRIKRRRFLMMTAVFEAAFMVEYLWSVSQGLSTAMGKGTEGLCWACYLFGAASWFAYAQAALETEVNCTVSMLPAVPAAALALLVPVMGLPENGLLSQVLRVAALVYGLIPSVQAFRLLRSRDHYEMQDIYRSLMLFPFLPLLFYVLQTVGFPQLPMLEAGTAMAILVLYLDDQESLISWDPLTQVNNRAQMMRYLKRKMAAPQPGRTLYLLFIDADGFKSINDRYGHVVGDEALVRISDAMKKSLPRSWSIARYGGDEFVVIGEAVDEDEVRGHCAAIQTKLSELNAAARAPYELTVSIGYAARDDSVPDIPSFLQAADENLYAAKARHKAAGKNA